MKFLAFNIVVLGALWLLLRADGVVSAEPPPASVKVAKPAAREPAPDLAAQRIEVLTEQLDGLVREITDLGDRVESGEAAGDDTSGGGEPAPAAPPPAAPGGAAATPARTLAHAEPTADESRLPESVATPARALAHADPAADDSSLRESAEAPVTIEGPMMSPAERRSALLTLAEEMELRFLASAVVE